MFCILIKNVLYFLLNIYNLNKNIFIDVFTKKKVKKYIIVNISKYSGTNGFLIVKLNRHNYSTDR